MRFLEKEIILLDSIDKIKNIVLENFTPLVRTIKQPAKQKTVCKEDIIGTWLLCDVHDSSEVINYGNIPGLRRCKLITPASFMNIDYNVNFRGLLAVMLGTYKIEDGVYTETIQYAGKGYEGFVDNVNPFGIIIDSAYMSLIPLENNPCSHDVWKKGK